MTEQHRRQLEIKGYNELLAEHCELVDRLADQQASIDALHLRIENLAAKLRRLGCTVAISVKIVVDFGHGWQIVRTPESGTPAAEDFRNGN